LATADRASTDDDKAILALQMDAIHSTSPASFLSVIGAVLALYVYWAPGLEAGLVVWFLAIFAIAATNVTTAAMRVRGLPASWTDEVWERFVCVMHLLSGFAWGIGGGWMLTFATDQQALLTIGIGLTAVTISIPSVVHQKAYNLFHYPIFWCYAVGAALSSLQFGLVISFGFFVLAPFATLIGRDLGRRLVTALRLSIENQRLVERLEQRSTELESANRELEVLSSTDPLTGVANRRLLMAFGRAAPAACAVLIVDIDHFKSYNDSFGHVDGDACLVEVARVLQAHARPDTDLVARLGGEEFAIVVGDLSYEQAATVCEDIRGAVERLHELEPIKVRRVVTVSIGFSVRVLHASKPFAQLMEEADAAVYRAKASGRNQVCAPALRIRRLTA
jgi:diguanylate cyclase (GGDEF)-like protein